MIDYQQKIHLILAIFLLVSLTSCIYIPQLQICASLPFVGKQVTKIGPFITEALNKFQIPDISGQTKYSGVTVKYSLNDTKQKFGIDWDHNQLKVLDHDSFNIVVNNINMNLTSNLNYKIGYGRKKHGILDINISNIHVDLVLSFSQPQCPDQSRGIGFSMQITQITVHTDKIVIVIQGKNIDNFLIKEIIALLKSRLPALIQKMVMEKGNPAINQLTCSPMHQNFQLGDNHYLVIINTTNTPHFYGDHLYADIDLTFVNTQTNSTNNQVENDNLPEINLFDNETNLSLLFSSNLMNSILWLIDDSQILKLNVNDLAKNATLPVQLTTGGLSILLPGLTKWGYTKQVILLVQPASKFNHLYVRNGKILAALSMSIRFVVKLGAYNQSVDECLKLKHCVEAVNLNVSIPFSSAIRIQKNFNLSGILQTVAIQQIKVTSSQIIVKEQQLKKILNSMISPARPQINSLIVDGIILSDNPLIEPFLELFQIKQMFMKIKQDYGAFGIAFSE